MKLSGFFIAYLWYLLVFYVTFLVYFLCRFCVSTDFRHNFVSFLCPFCVFFSVLSYQIIPLYGARICEG